jgi:NADPH:quinone reductase-like Zn-dependent oxidoreductase
MKDLMRAIVFTRYSRPEELELTEVPKPTPKDDEILVRILASSINSWDWEYLTGVPYEYRLLSGIFRPKPGKQRLGADIAGTVVAVGKHVTRFQPEDEVFGDLWDNWGGFAEYVCTHEFAVERKPANISFLEAAAIPQAGGLALQGLIQAGPINPGQKVLINGAGGGVGTFAVQLAKHRGAEVTGVDAPHKLNSIRALGADYVLDYTKVIFTKTGKQYDVILDCRCSRSFFEYKRALKQCGKYVAVGGKTLRILQVLLLGYCSSFTSESRELQLLLGSPNNYLADLKKFVETGKLLPVVDSYFKLNEVPKALRHFGEGRHTGKIVIDISS